MRPTTSPASSARPRGTGYFPQATVARVERALAGKNLTDGVMGAIVEDVAVQAPVQRQTEPSVTLFASDPARMDGFAPIRSVEGGNVTLDQLGRGEVYLNKKAPMRSTLEPETRLLVYVGAKPVRMRIREIVRFDGATTADSALLLPLAQAQRLFDKPGLIKGIAISNRGSGEAGIGLSDQVVAHVEAGRDTTRA